jgi:hypothetical protein
MEKCGTTPQTTCRQPFRKLSEGEQSKSNTAPPLGDAEGTTLHGSRALEISNLAITSDKWPHVDTVSVTHINQSVLIIFPLLVMLL